MSFQINNIRALQVFQILRQGAAILTSILLAKSMLSTVDIGIFEMLVFIGTTISFFWIAGLNQGMLPFFPKLPQKDRVSFIFQMFLLFNSLSFLVFILLFFFEKNITQLLVGQTDLPFFRLFSFYLLFYLPSFLIDFFYLLHDRAMRIVQFGVIAFSLHIIVVILPIYLGYGLEGSIYGLLGLGLFRYTWLLGVVYSLTKSTPSDSNTRWNTSVLSPYFSIAIPLILYALLSGFPAVFDSWLVGWFFQDATTFAIFRYGARELPLAIALANALSTAMIPQIVTNASQAMKDLRAKTLQLCHWIFPLSIILMLSSHSWFPLIFDEAFEDSSTIFNVFLLVIISRLLFPQTILIAFKKTKIILWISIAETLLNVLLSLIFVQYFGLVGIAFGTVIAYLFEKIVIAVYLFWKYQIAPAKYTPISWFSAYSIALLMAYYFS